MMKKLAIAMMLGIAAMSASAQVNYKMQVACSPQDVKTYDTNRLRSSFLMEKVMVPNEINVTYSMYDRLIFGGAVPATKELVLETIDPLKSKFFLERRELGVINIGGEGIVTVDGKEYTLKFKDALYVGRGKQPFPVALLFDIKQFAALPYSLFPAVVLHNPTLPYTLSCFLKGFQT